MNEYTRNILETRLRNLEATLPQLRAFVQTGKDELREREIALEHAMAAIAELKEDLLNANGY